MKLQDKVAIVTGAGWAQEKLLRLSLLRNRLKEGERIAYQRTMSKDI